MVGDRRVDVDRIDVRVFQQLTVVGVTGPDPVALTAFIKPLVVAAANRGDLRAGIVLVDRDELGPETQADDRHTDWLVAGHAGISFEPGRWMDLQSSVQDSRTRGRRQAPREDPTTRPILP